MNCLKEAAQVAGCDRCATAETDCAASNCSVPCSVPTSDDACRACACANHCLQQPAGCGLASVDACSDCAGASCTRRLASTTDTITVPVFFHFLHDRVDSSSGLPAYSVGANQNDTILDIDAQLAQVNSVLESARSDARRLQLVRTGVHYGEAPAAGTCPDPVSSTDAHRFYGGLNVLLTPSSPSCTPAATTAYAARASGSTLLRVLGNLLGIAPGEQGADPWQITRDQLVRMHNYARWRLGASDAVPEAERERSSGFMYGPPDPIWDKLTNRDWALNNASVFEATSPGPVSSLPLIETFTVSATGAARRVLMVRISARIVGVPSENLVVTVGLLRHTVAMTRSAIRIVDGMLVAEEAFDKSADSPLDKLRNKYGAGHWTVRIDDTANLTLSELRLEIVLGDRAFVSYDRHARGVADVMVYRGSTSELLTAMNPANRTTAFGTSVSDPVPPLPDPRAKVIAGDVDGNGQVDLLARRGPALWIAFNKGRFQPWRPGSIAGTELPSATDQVLMGDFDGDGFGDLLRRRPDYTIDRSVWGYYRGFGDGAFEAERKPVAEQVADINWTIADLTRAGHSDLIVQQNMIGRIAVVYNTTRRPTTSGTMPSFYGAWWPLIGDVQTGFTVSDRMLVLDANQDGSEDILVRRTGSGEWLACLNQGQESFTAPRRLTIGGETAAFSESDTFLGSAP